jgi:hypothetical protein
MKAQISILGLAWHKWEFSVSRRNLSVSLHPPPKIGGKKRQSP